MKFSDRKLARLLDRVVGRRLRAVVIGDIIVERDLFGQATRLAPEADTPVVLKENERATAGGAGNVAANLVGLGAQATLVGFVGENAPDAATLAYLRAAGVETASILVLPGMSSPQQIRVFARNQQLLRYDRPGTGRRLPAAARRALRGHVLAAMREADFVVISDQDCGTIDAALLRAIVRAGRRKKQPVIVDACPRRIRPLRGATAITLNQAEAQLAAGVRDGDPGRTARLLAERLGATVFVTRGAEGMIAAGWPGGAPVSHAAERRMLVADSSGAGDTVTAAVALALAAGSTADEAARLANRAAGLSVSQPGIAPVAAGELKRTLASDLSAHLEETISVKQKVLDAEMQKIERVAQLIISAYRRRNKIIAFGNGGSAADANHFVAELVGRFRVERRSLPALTLSGNDVLLSSLANDFGWEAVFERQMEAFATPRDVVIGFTTSGTSKNVLRAMRRARELGAYTVGFTGQSGGPLANLCDVTITVPSDNVPRIQEAHMAIIHALCDLLERELFYAQEG